MNEFLIALMGERGELDAWLELQSEAEIRELLIPFIRQRDELLAALKDSRSIFALAYDCAENGRNDECLLHTGIGVARSDAAISKAEKQLAKNADFV